MVIKFLSKFPGGFLLIAVIPIMIMIGETYAFDSNELIQVNNAAILAIAIGILYVWRRAFIIAIYQQENAGLMWLNLGTWGIVATTVVNVLYSTIIHLFSDGVAQPIIIAGLRLGYIIFFSCLFLAPLAEDGHVPLKSWKWLGAIIGLSVGLTILGLKVS